MYKLMKKENIDFPSTEKYSKKMIEKVQKELLEMSKIVCRILEKHNIPYFMAFGTLIGAVKFQGFLPWDDDIDLFLFDENYDAAISVLEKEIPKHLIVHSERNDDKYFLAWNSVKNTKVEVKDNGIYNIDNRLLKYRCLGLDLYRLKKVKRKDLEQYTKDEAIKFFKRKLNAGLMSQETFDEHFKVLELQYGLKEKTKDVFNGEEEVYTFVVKMNGPILPESIFPLKKYMFEDIELFGPNNPIEVLSASFLNLEDMPPFEERKTHLQQVIFKENKYDN